VKVVAGIIENARGEVLLAERPVGKTLAGMWEFPGGKIESGERAEEALRRELKEELELDVEVHESLGSFPYTYEWGTIELNVFRVSALNKPKPTKDVLNFRWTAVHDLDVATLAPADVEPFHKYVSFKKSRR
jgi:8-oxo-dGTP diphosphatase